MKKLLLSVALLASCASAFGVTDQEWRDLNKKVDQLIELVKASTEMQSDDAQHTHKVLAELAKKN